jgi:SAM-dependent methyltransferase
MSEASDDAQLPTQDEVAPPIAVDAPSDADDVEVLAHAPAPEAAPARHDSVSPTSRKLAPPPKPKRDSSQPSSNPPPAVEAGPNVGSLKAPNAPSISFQEASSSSRDAVAAALTGSDSLRAIGEALAKDTGAFSTSETATGSRPSVPRPRSQPAINALADSPPSGVPETQPSQELLTRSPSELPRARDKVPTVPDEPATPSVASPPKSGSIFAQRIIPVGTHSDRPPPVRASSPPPSRLKSSPPPKPLRDPEVTVEVAPPTMTRLPSEPDITVEVAPPPVTRLPSEPDITVEVAPPPVAKSPSEIEITVEVAPDPVAKPPPALDVTLELAPAPAPVPKGTPAQAPKAAPAPVPVPVAKPPSVPPLPAVIAVGIAAVDVPLDESPPDIPITTDFDEDTPTRPSASPSPFESPIPPPLGSPPPPIPAEATPAPPALSAADAAARAEALAPEDVAPDSADRIPVEELSREDSPSLPPEELTPAMPPPAPSARPDAKAEAKPQPPPPPKRPAPAPASEPVTAAPPESREIASPETEKKKTKQKRPWWEELFSEDFVRANWKVSDEQIKREVTFVEESLGVAPGGVVLDLGCGSGQHAVELASRGYGVVGYDLSLYQLALAADIAQERSQKINFLQGDMREMAFEEMFDGIFCWNTTFGYFEEDKNFSVAERAFRALRPGGMLLVDVINRDFVAAHTPSSVWFEGDSCVCMDDAVIDYFTSRLRVKRSVILDDGRTRECTYSVRLYSFHELGKLLHEVGFRVTEVSGHPATPGVFLGQASPRILMLAQRP